MTYYCKHKNDVELCAKCEDESERRRGPERELIDRMVLVRKIEALQAEHNLLLSALKRAERETGFINCQELSEVIAKVGAGEFVNVAPKDES